MRSIGGQLDYALLARLNQPRDRATLAREARKLADQGLTERDIGAALALDPTAVRRLLSFAQVPDRDGIRRT